jgi:hypothetical protein
MTMQLITEAVGHGVIARVYECDCELPDCRRQWLICGLEGERAMLGLTVATSCDPEEIATGLATMISGDEKMGPPAAVIEHGLALVGMPWGALECSEVAGAQRAAWAMLPAWMDEVSRGQVWACRGVRE